MAAGFVGSTKSFPFSFDMDVDDEAGRSTPHLNQRTELQVLCKGGTGAFLGDPGVLQYVLRLATDGVLLGRNLIQPQFSLRESGI
ncbi:jg23076 [Pararge aegeria aegeria]|uniref:Jg23076 protein n=1 Tax=Pararge aegeria aegeria TaxID=348720 RepID=A0A8S4S4L6_9NEOP|nr:jg23076 [Pararge aegeria aegeria]